MNEYSKIKEIGKVITGKTPSTENEENFGGDFPFITPSDISTFDEKYIVETERTISSKGYKKLKNNLLPMNTICFVCIGSTIGKMCLTNKPSFTNQQINALIVNENYDAQYVFYLLRYVKGYFQQIGAGTGSGKGIVNKSTFEKSRICIEKDLFFQTKIASILSAYDDLIENNKKRIKILEQMAENIYKEWFVRFRFPGYETAEFENGIPKGWEIKCADTLFDITIGKTPNRKIFDYYCDRPINCKKWASITDIGNSEVYICDTKEYLTNEAVKNCKMIIVPKGSILLSFKLSVGKVGITDCEMCTNEAIAHFYINDDRMREYLFLFLRNFDYSKLGNTSSIGTAVNSKIVKKMEIMVPQKQLLQLFHIMLKPIFSEISLITKQNQNLIKQRDFLLPRLMSGKLEVKNAK